MMREGFIQIAYWTINVLVLFWLIIWWNWYLVLCITTLYELCMCWGDYIGCYCAINNRALDCRTVKEEGPFRANVLKGLAFKCALRVNWWWPGCDAYLGMANTCKYCINVCKGMCFTSMLDISLELIMALIFQVDYDFILST